MKKLDFEIYSENLIIRFTAIILAISINLNYLNNIFYIATYVLMITILTLSQELITNKKMKIAIYIVTLVLGLSCMYLNFFIGSVIVIVLLSEICVKIEYGNIIGVIVLTIFVFVRINAENSFIYLPIGIMCGYALNAISKNRELLKRDERQLETLKESFYKNIKKHDDFKNLSEQNLRVAKLEERNRIGREMHDKIGHVLAGSIMRLEASKIILNSDKEKGLEMMNESIENLRSGMNDIRDIIHKITPKADDIGIIRVKNKLNNKILNSGINLNFKVDGDIEKINFNKWIFIENAMLELSTNSLKYSKCKNIDVSISVFNKIIRISFKDDGIGCINFKKGFGLSKLEEEVLRKEGIMTVNPLNGFEVVITLKRRDDFD